MPNRVSTLLQFLVVRGNIRFTIVIEGSRYRSEVNGLSFEQALSGGHSRQSSVVLQLILQLGKAFDDALAFLRLLFIGDSDYSSVKIINGASLGWLEKQHLR